MFVEHRTKGEKLLTRFHDNQQVQSNASRFLGVPVLLKPLHDVLRVTLRSGEKYAVDLASAQHGHDEAVIPWKQFESERILNVLSIKPVNNLALHQVPGDYVGGELIHLQANTPKGLLRVDDYSPQMIDHFHRERHATDGPGKLVDDDIFQLLNMELLHWQARNYSLKDLWRLPYGRYLANEIDLVQFVDWAFNFPNSGYKTVSGTETRRQIRGENWIHGLW